MASYSGWKTGNAVRRYMVNGSSRRNAMVDPVHRLFITALVESERLDMCRYKAKLNKGYRKDRLHWSYAARNARLLERVITMEREGII